MRIRHLIGGIVAVIIRAGFGQTEDNKFRQNYRNARAAGLKVGAYWYSYAYCVADAESSVTVTSIFQSITIWKKMTKCRSANPP